MIEREITAVFQKAVKTHPIVTVFGPRQSGKTTLVRHVLPLERNRKLNLLEIKGAMTPDNSFGANMEKMRKCTEDILSCNVVYAGEDWPLKGGGRFVNFMKAAQLSKGFCR